MTASHNTKFNQPLPLVSNPRPFRWGGSRQRSTDMQFYKDQMTGLYKCHLCNYKTVYRGSLRSHFAVHSNARPYACEMCTYEAKRLNDLKKHKVLKHGFKLNSLRSRQKSSPKMTNGTNLKVVDESAQNNTSMQPVIGESYTITTGEGAPQSYTDDHQQAIQYDPSALPITQPEYITFNENNETLLAFQGHVDCIADKTLNYNGNKDGLNVEKFNMADVEYEEEFEIKKEPVDMESCHSCLNVLGECRCKNHEIKLDLKNSRFEAIDEGEEVLSSAIAMMEETMETAVNPVSIVPKSSCRNNSDNANNGQENNNTPTASPTMSTRQSKKSSPSLSGVVPPQTPPRARSRDSTSGHCSGTSTSSLISHPSLVNPAPRPSSNASTTNNQSVSTSPASRSGRYRPSIASPGVSQLPAMFSCAAGGSPASACGAPRTWHCPHCGIMYLDGALFSMHMGLHSPADPWTCSMCDRKFHDVYGFTSHYVSGHGS